MVQSRIERPGLHALVRDDGTSVMLPRSQAAHLSQARGYDDLDLARCCEQWLAVRERLRDETPES